MKVLVTGGAGFIGSALVRRLAAEGHQVTVLDSMSRGRPQRLTGLPVRILAADVRDATAVSDAAESCDTVCHLAAVNGTATFYAEPRRVIDVAVRGTLNVLDACERHQVRDLLLVSSSEAYQVPPVVPAAEAVPLSVPDPLNPRYSYGGGKIASELMAVAWARSGALARLIIARPHNVTGPDMGREHVIPQFAIRMNALVTEHPQGVIPFPVQGTGMETRSFCWIGDCITQFMLLLGHAGPLGIYHVGTMDERTIADAAHAVADCYGRAIEIIPGPLAEGSPARRLPDTGKLEAMGYKPSVSFAETVARTVDWYRFHG